MSRRNASRFIAVVLGAVASVAIWVNFTNIGNNAALRAHQQSVRGWGEPLEGTANPADDLEIRSSRIGPYKEVLVTFTSRITHTYRQFQVSMLVKDIPTNKQIMVWEQISTGSVAAANTIDDYFTAPKPTPFDDGGSERTIMTALKLLAVFAICIAVIIWWCRPEKQ